jgi:hypothetical protein
MSINHIFRRTVPSWKTLHPYYYWSNEPVLVVVRDTAASRIYHRFGKPLFEKILRLVGADPEAIRAVPSRHPVLAQPGLPAVVAPRLLVDARSLMHAADVVVGVGGTMVRGAVSSVCRP